MEMQLLHVEVDGPGYFAFWGCPYAVGFLSYLLSKPRVAGQPGPLAAIFEREGRVIGSHWRLEWVPGPLICLN